MPDDPIARLTAALSGRYRIERKLGEGGMASVYLAEDVKHERKVALKVLRPELAAVIGAARFLSEIKTTANLQHPHILALFDSGEADDFLYYVMPFIDGETLRDKLAREKQLSVDQAVRIANSVADALDYAHRQGVIHRDIKPANILLHDGRPVVADFGIAVAISAAGGGRMTETGLSLGTPHYMSPEQASADRDLSVRSDVYSLGCVLYEMIAGQPPHTGPSVQSILVRILTERPRPLTELRHTVPAHVSAAVMKSIEKLPADRFDSAKDFTTALADPTFTYAPTEHVLRAPAVGVPTSAGATRHSRAWLPWAVAAAMAASAVWGWLRPTAPTPVQRYPMNVEDIVLTSGGTPFSISPDGTTIAFAGENNQIFWRPLSALEAQVVPGSEGSRSPFFSPDGRSIGFTNGPPSNDAIRTFSLDGAPPRTLSGDHFPGAAWGDDGFVYYVDIEGGLYRVSDQGGDPETLIEPGSDRGVRLPEPLPGGKTVLVHSGARIGTQTQNTGSEILALDLKTRELTKIEDGSHARFAHGYLFWVRERTLFAALFDPKKLEFTGQGIEIADGLIEALEGAYQYAVSGAGMLVYQGGAGAALDDFQPVQWIDQAGNVEVIEALGSSNFADVDNVSLSPDGRYLALEVGDEMSSSLDQPVQVWVFDFDQISSQRLTFQGGRNAQPRWMADGRHVAYLSSQADGPDGIWMQPFDRTGADELLFQADRPIVGFDVARVEGLPIIVVTGGATENLWLATPGTSELEPYLVTDFQEGFPRISPDGRWVVYTSDESGRSEVYVRAFPDGGRPWPISRNGGHLPLWSHAGDEIFYEAGRADRHLVRARLSLGSEVRIVSQSESQRFPVAALEMGANGRASASYDVSLDDQRLIGAAGVVNVGTANQGHGVVVLGLFEELKARRKR